MYDEANLQPDGTPSSAGSELWVIDAKIMAQSMAAVVCRVELPQRIPYGQVSPFEFADRRLHGTWLPQAWTKRQRSRPPIEQPLLQDKLALSRIQAFVSIVFSRPSHREKSRFERVVLALLWPSAVGLLGLAIMEGYNYKYVAI